MTHTTKEVARKRLLARRRELSLPEVYQASQLVAARVMLNLNLQEAEVIHVYTPAQNTNEINSRVLMQLLIGRYHELTIVWGESSSDAPIPRGMFDVIFVPVVGFNRDGFRLGFGGGWYDRFLLTQPEAKVIGLAYDWSEVNFTPETHDQPLDMVITQERVKRYKKRQA